MRRLKTKILTEDIMEKISYLFFGVLSTVVNIGAYWICSAEFRINYLISNTIAWTIAVIFAFVTNKLFVFKSHNESFASFIKEISSFLFFRILTLFLDDGTMILLVQILKTNDVFAKIVANGLVVIANYAASKLFIFKK